MAFLFRRKKKAGAPPPETPKAVAVAPAEGKDYDYLIKVLMVGQMNDGLKARIMLRLRGDDIGSSYISTIGVDFIIHTMTIDNKVVRMQVWGLSTQSHTTARNKKVPKAISRGQANRHGRPRKVQEHYSVVLPWRAWRCHCRGRRIS